MPSDERFWPRIVISIDGGRALLLKRPTEQPYKVSERAASAFPFSAVLPDGTEVDIRMLTSSVLRGQPAAPSWLGLPATATDILNLLAECAIGDFLDSDEVIESESTTAIPAFSGYIETIRARPSVSDEVLHRYIAWKTYWSWKFEQRWTLFDYADQLRLGRRVSQFAQMARVDEGSLWSIRAEGDDGLALRAERELLLAVRQGRIGTGFFSPIFHVGERLSFPEFAVPGLHFRKALAFVSSQPVDRENAAKEAVSAVESLVQIV